MRGVGLLVLLGAMGCISSSRSLPPVVVPPVPHARIAFVAVFDDQGELVTQIHGTLILDTQPDAPIDAHGDGALVFALEAAHQPCDDAWLTVTAPDAAAEVRSAALALTDGSAAVAAAHPVAPTAVRASDAVSDVPFAE